MIDEQYNSIVNKNRSLEIIATQGRRGGSRGELQENKEGTARHKRKSETQQTKNEVLFCLI